MTVSTLAQTPTAWREERKVIDGICYLGKYRAVYAEYKIRALSRRDPVSIAAWARLYRYWCFDTRENPSLHPPYDDQQIVALIETRDRVWNKDNLFLLIERLRLADVENPPPSEEEIRKAKPIWATYKHPDGHITRQLQHAIYRDIDEEHREIRSRVLKTLKQSAPNQPVVQFYLAIEGAPSNAKYARAATLYPTEREEFGAPGAWWLWHAARELRRPDEAVRWQAEFHRLVDVLPSPGKETMNRLFPMN